MQSLALLVTSCVAVLAGAAPAATISRVDVSPHVIEAADGQEVRIRFHLSAPGTVAIGAFDESQKEVWTSRESFQRGYAEFIWDGRVAEDFASAGTYTFALAVDSKPRSDTALHRSDLSATSPVVIYDFAFDRSTGVLSYRLEAAATVQIRFGVGNGGPLLRTINTYQEPGRQEIRWDGWDESRVANLLGDKTVLANVQATAIPYNAVIVHDTAQSKSPAPVAFEIRILQPGADRSIHRRTVIAEIRAVSDVDSLLRSDRYEWLFFVDHRFVFEEEKPATNPYHVEFDATSLSEGAHVLTVNLAGQQSGFVQTCSARFSIDK